MIEEIADVLAIAYFGVELVDAWRSRRKGRRMPAFECGCDSVLLLHCADHPDTFGPVGLPPTPSSTDPNALASKEPDALAKAEERYQKFGAEMFARADAQVKEARGKSVVLGIQRLIERVDELHGQRDALEFLIAFNERRLAAVKAGAFRLMSNGNIRYSEAELNQSQMIRGNTVIALD